MGGSAEVIGRKYCSLTLIECMPEMQLKKFLASIQHSITKWEEVKIAVSALIEDNDDTWAIEQLSMVINSCGMCHFFRIGGGEYECSDCPLHVEQKACFHRGGYREIFSAIEYITDASASADYSDYAKCLTTTVVRIGDEIISYSDDLVEYLRGLTEHIVLIVKKKGSL